jgi:cobalt/nickel transport protein
MHPRMALVFLCLAYSVSTCAGHYHVFLPDSASVKKDQEVIFTLRFGHPFEHQFFDATAPERLIVLTPQRKKIDLTNQLEKTTVKGDKRVDVAAYRLKYRPADRGDHVFVLTSGRMYMEEERDYVQDTVKVILHVQAQKNWDADSGLLEFVPLTRPYGLAPGMVFQAEMVDRFPMPGVAHPMAGALVEVERFNSAPPAMLPADEQITRTVKLDRQGKVITTLPDPGWWSITATSPHVRKHTVKGKEMPLRFRSTLWVFVDEPPGRK